MDVNAKIFDLLRTIRNAFVRCTQCVFVSTLNVNRNFVCLRENSTEELYVSRLPPADFSHVV